MCRRFFSLFIDLVRRLLGVELLLSDIHTIIWLLDHRINVAVDIRSCRAQNLRVF